MCSYCHVFFRKDWRLLGDQTWLKVRMSNMLAENAAVLMRLVLRWRPRTLLVIEQPKGSWLWKLDEYRALIKDFSLARTLTYLGFFGMDILKPCHLVSNMKLLR